MEEISLREIIEVLLKRKWAIAGITILAVLISGVISFFVLSPVYEAEAILNIRGSNNPNVEIADSNLDMLLEQLTSLPQYDIETYKHQIQDYTFLEGVIKQMGLEKEGYTPLSLQKAVNIEQIPNTSLMKIVVHDGNPTRAAEIANAVTGLFVEGINHQNQEQVSRASIYLEEQMKEKKAELETIMEKYRAFLQDSGTAEELQEEISSKVAAITASKLELEYMQVNLSAAELKKKPWNGN
jgi:succinoglycan biosynthesis transport protein ExoP